MFDWFFGVSAALAETAGTVGEATAAEPNSAAALITTLLPMALIMVVFYFMLIRAQKKEDKKVKELLSSLKVGVKT